MYRCLSRQQSDAGVRSLGAEKSGCGDGRPVEYEPSFGHRSLRLTGIRYVAHAAGQDRLSRWAGGLCLRRQPLALRLDWFALFLYSVAMRTLAIIGCALFLVPCMFAQNWKQVHKADEVKWAKATGLDQSPSTKSGGRLRPFPTKGRRFPDREPRPRRTGRASPCAAGHLCGRENLPDPHCLPPAFREQVSKVVVGRAASRWNWLLRYRLRQRRRPRRRTASSIVRVPTRQPTAPLNYT